MAIRRVLEEPRFRDGAQRMAASIRRDVNEDRAVMEMEALTARRESATPAVALPSQIGRSA